MKNVLNKFIVLLTMFIFVTSCSFNDDVIEYEEKLVVFASLVANLPVTDTVLISRSASLGEDIDAEEMEITHIAAHRGQIKRGFIPRARGRATPSNHYQVNLEIFLEDFNTVDDELEDEF